MAHFLDCVSEDKDFNVSVMRDYRTGVNYLCWYKKDDGGRVYEKGFCPMYGADGKPLITDLSGNILPEQTFDEKEFNYRLSFQK